MPKACGKMQKELDGRPVFSRPRRPHLCRSVKGGTLLQASREGMKGLGSEAGGESGREADRQPGPAGGGCRVAAAATRPPAVP